MRIGRVHGSVVSPVQHSFYQGRKQLIVRYVDDKGAFVGEDYVVAVDVVGAGMGQLVLVEDEGTSARQLLGNDANAPVRSVIIGIVDSVNC